MSKRLQQLTKQALELIRQINADTTGPKEDNIEALEEVKEEIDAHLNALRD